MLLIRMVLLLTGLLMTVVPGACTRKDQRGDLNAEKGYGRLASGLWQQRSYGLLPQNFSENRL